MIFSHIKVTGKHRIDNGLRKLTMEKLQDKDSKSERCDQIYI